MIRIIRKALFCVLFGPVIAFVTVFSWFTVWPLMAFIEWLHEGSVSWRDLTESSWGFADEFLDAVRNA